MERGSICLDCSTEAGHSIIISCNVTECPAGALLLSNIVSLITDRRPGGGGIAQVEGAVAEPLYQPVHLMHLAVLPVQLLLAAAPPPRQLPYCNIFCQNI